MLKPFASARALVAVLGLGILAGLVIAAAEPAPTTQPTPPSAEQVLKEVLESHQPVQPLLPVEPGRPIKGTVSTRPTNPVAGEQGQQDLLPDGYPVKRTGRLVYDGAWWSLAAEGAGQETNPEKPIRLLPNRLLETMEATSVGGTRPMLFTVTGQVTEYRGTNYLLVLNVMIKRDQGNLSK